MLSLNKLLILPICTFLYRGKSLLAQALGNAACRNHRTTRYIGLQDFFDDLAVADAAGMLNKTFDSYIKLELLIIDDAFLMQPSVIDVTKLLKLDEKQMHVGSTIYCAQLPPEEWHKRIEKKIVADALLRSHSKSCPYN